MQLVKPNNGVAGLDPRQSSRSFDTIEDFFSEVQRLLDAYDLEGAGII